MKVLTTDQIRMADEYTIAHEPVLSLDLMERAASGLCGFIGPPGFPEQQVLIFAGPGNNGGDGIALARMLVGARHRIILYLVTPDRSWSPDARANIERLPVTDRLQVVYLDPEAQLPRIGTDDIVVDAIFGSGLTREPAGFNASLIDHINAARVTVIAIDIPSGLYGEDNRMNSKRHVIRATVTLTFQFPKLSFFLPENRAFVGEWKVIPIGLHPEFVMETATLWHYIDYKDIKDWLVPREKFNHKGNFGHALLIAGSTGKMGAAVLAASAALRSGSGLTTVLVPSGGNSIVQSAVPEAMTIPDLEADRWTWLPDLSPFTAIGAGPGVGTAADTWPALENLLKVSAKPLVLDADALNLLAQHAGSLLLVPKNSILTPHPGEYKRLFGDDPDDYSRILRLKELAQFYQLVIVLKGAHTAVAGPDGSVWFNTSGNPGMATGGSGDVLTGMITGLAAQGYDPFTAARLGVFLHGLSGDIAAETRGMESLTAGDIIGSIGAAFLRIHHSKPD